MSPRHIDQGMANSNLILYCPSLQGCTKYVNPSLFEHDVTQVEYTNILLRDYIQAVLDRPQPEPILDAPQPILDAPQPIPLPDPQHPLRRGLEFVWNHKATLVASGLAGASVVGAHKIAEWRRKHPRTWNDKSFSTKLCVEVVHLMSISVQVWALTPVLNKLEPGFSININQFLTASQRQVNLPLVGLTCTPLYPWIVWNLWKARNDWVFENRRNTAGTVIKKSVKEAKEWQEAQRLCAQPKQLIGIHRNQAHLQQGTNCFIDASWMYDTLDCGLGWCFKDENMVLLSEETSNRRNVASALIGETLAIKAALIAAKTKGIEVLNCFSDSLSLITLMNTNGVTNELKLFFMTLGVLRMTSLLSLLILSRDRKML